MASHPSIVSDVARDEKWLRLRCAGCGKHRALREADLLGRQSRYLARMGDLVTVTKPCPHCGNNRPLPIRWPVGEMPAVPRSWRLGSLRLPSGDGGRLN